LANAVSLPEINNGGAEFLRISGHQQVDLAKACLNRKMKERVRAEFVTSQNDLAELFASLDNEHKAELDGIVSELSHLTNGSKLTSNHVTAQHAAEHQRHERLAA